MSEAITENRINATWTSRKLEMESDLKYMEQCLDQALREKEALTGIQNFKFSTEDKELLRSLKERMLEKLGKL